MSWARRVRARLDDWDPEPGAGIPWALAALFVAAALVEGLFR